MANAKTSAAIAAWAEKQTAPADTPSYKRLTDSERVLILKLHDDGLTQVEIAQRLNRAQSTISDVLDAFTDTTDVAKRYFRANALRMAENVVERGQPRDHNVALAGIDVLKAGDQGGIKIAIGLSLPGLPSQSEGLQKQATIVVGADNQSYVNSTK